MLEFRSEDLYVQVHAPPSHAANEILTPDALRLVGLLCAKFDVRRQALLEARKCRAQDFDSGLVPNFLPPSPATTDPSWKCAPIPADIQDRRVEITGPVDRKMVINGLNSGANVYMAGTCILCVCVGHIAMLQTLINFFPSSIRQILKTALVPPFPI
jgi:malate synthase